jgi:hypothetical protein
LLMKKLYVLYPQHIARPPLAKSRLLEDREGEEDTVVGWDKLDSGGSAWIDGDEMKWSRRIPNKVRAKLAERLEPYEDWSPSSHNHERITFVPWGVCTLFAGFLWKPRKGSAYWHEVEWLEWEQWQVSQEDPAEVSKSTR